MLNNSFAPLLGHWSGTVRTWFEPDVLADESAVSGVIAPIFDGRFARHSYTGSMQGKPRQGEETIAWNKVGKLWEVAWMDTFHMSTGILFSSGPERPDGFEVMGHYDVGGDNPKWGWRTVYQLPDADHLVITAYNVVPGEAEAKAVETMYARVAAP